MKKNQTENMQLKNTMNKAKMLYRASWADLIMEKQDYVTWKIYHLKYPVRRDKEKRMKKKKVSLYKLWDTIKQTTYAILESWKKKKGRHRKLI